METKILEELGLSPNESKVYLALLESGQSTAGKISKIANIHRTNVYDTLNRLKEKRLVTYIINKNKKTFKAEDPKKLLFLLKLKEESFKTILPNLISKHDQHKRKENARIFEGIEGIKAITDEIIATNKKIFAFGIPKDVSAKMKPFLASYHRKRLSNKQWMFHIYNENARDRIKYLNTLKYTKATYLPKEYDSPATTTIYGNKLAFYIWSENPFSVVIESDRMAQSYRNYFKLLWKIATGEELKFDNYR